MQSNREFQEAQDAIDQIGEAIGKALERAPVADVVSMLTGAFVGLVLEVVKREGHDVSRQVTINGGRNRDITIHAPKPSSAPAADGPITH